MGKRGVKQWKFGKRMNFYLSKEVIEKLVKMAPLNKTAFIEALILKKWGENAKN